MFAVEKLWCIADLFDVVTFERHSAVFPFVGPCGIVSTLCINHACSICRVVMAEMSVGAVKPADVVTPGNGTIVPG